MSGLPAGSTSAGGTVGDTPEFASFGQPIESFMAMEGVGLTSDHRIQTQGGNYFDYNAMEEAKVQAISNGPEIPSRGPALTMLLKSGGNQLHGGGSYAYSSEHTESNNIDDGAAGAGDHGRQSAPEPHRSGCGYRRPHRPRQAVVLHVRPVSAPGRHPARHLQAGRHTG